MRCRDGQAIQHRPGKRNIVNADDILKHRRPLAFPEVRGHEFGVHRCQATDEVARTVNQAVVLFVHLVMGHFENLTVGAFRRMPLALHYLMKTG